MMIQPSLTPMPDANRYMLNNDYTFALKGKAYVVPAGFVFDGASIPFVGWLPTFTPFHPKVMVAALIHDWFHKYHKVPRALADKFFKTCLVDNGASNIKAQTMYAALRCSKRIVNRSYR